MKKLLFILGITLLFGWNSAATAAFISGSTGADGAFNPTGNVEVVLPPDGILNYTTVNIPVGVTITFKKNAANTPVYMLATGDVTVAGTINVAAANATSTAPSKGGPGGFDGGFGGDHFYPGGKGFGPGGGNPAKTSSSYGGGGSFGSGGSYYTGVNDGSAGPLYGNARLLPLIGGSGGGGGGGLYGDSGHGGGGGGAILIASTTSISIAGAIKADGGLAEGWSGGASGSGGAIKLVANSISGEGAITAKNGPSSNYVAGGGTGRIRLEAYSNSRFASTNPIYSFGEPGSIFVPNLPNLSITSVAGTPVPANAAGAYNQPDIMLASSTTNPVAVEISATHIPVGTAVQVWVLPRNGNATSSNATLSGSDQASTATASVTISTVYANVITAEATFTVQQAMIWNGEAIEKVRATASLGNGTKIVYITSSGKEIDAESLLAAR